MSARNTDLDRLLGAAARAAGNDAPPEMPFAFETRVVALARAGDRRNQIADLTRFVRWIGVAAVVVLSLASAGAYQQLTANEQRVTPLQNDYAIADSAIQTEFLR
jgi:anti-sigma-K factor RskA